MIDAVGHNNIFTRILNIFSRRRICVESMQSVMIQEQQRFIIHFSETQENAEIIASKIGAEIDVISVSIYGQLVARST